MKIKTEGLIIKEENIGEADKLLTIITAEYGILRAFATGARKINSKRKSTTSLFSYSRFLLNKTRDTYRIIEAENIQMFYGLRDNIIKMSLASYFCSIALYVASMDTNGAELLRMLLNCFYYISENKKNERLIKAIFEFKVVNDAGYAPNFNDCAGCGNKSFKSGFVDLEGEVYCENCKNANNLFYLNESLLNALRYMSSAETQKLFRFIISDENIENLNQFTERYLSKHMEKQFKTLDFYNSLL